MTNLQLYLNMGVPIFTVLFALLISLFQSNRLSDRTDRQIEELSDKIDRIVEQHYDILMIVEQILALADRQAKMESR